GRVLSRFRIEAVRLVQHGHGTLRSALGRRGLFLLARHEADGARGFMNALGERIAALIAAQGPLTIAQFMTIAMHDRESGYYATRNPIGVEGDFITAPEVSQMFGELVGLWCVQTWIDQGEPARARFVELGPGRGTLM